MLTIIPSHSLHKKNLCVYSIEEEDHHQGQDDTSGDDLDILLRVRVYEVGDNTLRGWDCWGMGELLKYFRWEVCEVCRDLRHVCWSSSSQLDVGN